MKHWEYVTENRPNPISAAIAYYPACEMGRPPRNPTMTTQVHLAEDDDLARIHHCYPLTNSTYDVRKHPNATHAFDVYIPPQVRLNFTHRFDLKITLDASRMTREFLNTYLR